ncbi:vacuolar protein-sorting-associated protein 25 [Coccinella septempunctata]|uniref:vacuolar protein-sorting-associated protein 25 n=1 Tax=Coccinella septempunctata TaxID=41139 RepID=UPI001D07EF2F|nr:vacuolar protein-sorting-associated protein 25 [Coccinella septempunctata]
MTDVEINWPWQYNFPPFFTLQPTAQTRSKQLAAWKTLILDYCRQTKTYTLDVREAVDWPLFYNSTINRRLNSTVIVSVLSELSKSSNCAALDKAKNRWEIYWHTLEEWASMIYGYICDSGLQNTVLTFYELTNGTDVQEQEFAGMQTEVLIKVLRVLEDERKCELILSDDMQGVKFF